VEDGVTGSLFEAGNAQELAQQVRHLWENPQLCNRMGRAGQQKVMREYSEDAYFHNLMAVYETAIQRSRSSAAVPATPLVQISNIGLPSSTVDGR
jgi:glycosyltransferase involved in cell wall biosynthesis